jgi:ABC-2 type transport system permease protein
MRALRLARLFVRLGAMSEMAYRANFFIHSFECLISLATGLSVLWVVFLQTSNVNGWTWDELMVVLGLYFLCFGFISGIVGPSVKTFMTDVWEGTLDFLLTKPANHLLLATTRRILIWHIVEVLLGTTIVSVSLWRLGGKIGMDQALMFFILLSTGAVLLYAFWIVLGTLAFWTTRLENVLLIFYNMYEAGRWPVGMYPFWLRTSLTFVIPVAFAVTLPAEAIIGRLTWPTVLGAVALAIPNMLIARWFFGVGLRHYSGASA